jgi:hypothetical protein
MPESILTPAQQALSDFLDKLSTSESVTPELLEEGNTKLDAAVEEYQSLQESIHGAAKAINTAHRALPSTN